MKSLYRLCLFAGALYFVGAGIVAGGYFLYYRPMWMTADILDRVPEAIRSSAATLESLRQTALNGHQLLISGFATLDSAINLILILSLGAALILLYVGAKLRTAAKQTPDAL